MTGDELREIRKSLRGDTTLCQGMTLVVPQALENQMALATEVFVLGSSRALKDSSLATSQQTHQPNFPVTISNNRSSNIEKPLKRSAKWLSF